MTLSITIPDRIGEALARHARASFDMTPAEFLKAALFAASHHREGFNLVLQLAPLAGDPNQIELPLDAPETAAGEPAQAGTTNGGLAAA